MIERTTHLPRRRCYNQFSGSQLLPDLATHQRLRDLGQQFEVCDRSQRKGELMNFGYLRMLVGGEVLALELILYLKVCLEFSISPKDEA